MTDRRSPDDAAPGSADDGRPDDDRPTVSAIDAELLDVAVEGARRAGTLLLDGRGQARAIDTKSSATDMVSEMDRGAEALIRAVIAERRPGDAVLGEEGGQTSGRPKRSRRPPTGMRWIVDPLDGTTNYLYGFPAWSVSVAVERDGQVVVGAVLDPTHDELWTAVRGAGARLNGIPLRRLGDGGGLSTALVATGFGYLAERRSRQGPIVAELLPVIRDIRRAGSAALDLCWVAAGRLDAYFEDGTQLWDWAAGALVARENGAWVGGFDDDEPTAEGILAARPALAAELSAALRAARLRAGART